MRAGGGHVIRVLAHEPLIRLSAAALVLLAMMVLEHAFPRRSARLGWRRWPANLGLAAISALLVRLAAPLGLVGAAVWAEGRGFGLFPATGAPYWIAAPLSVVLLDLTVYAQHRLFHAVPLLWRLHRVHHADPELDASSGFRFHPAEILLSLAVKIAAAVALGAPPEAVLAFEVLLNVTAIFNHANLALPVRLDAWLRLLLVTPDMHRTHHSEIRAECDSDFGFCLPWWDRLFGTYRAQPEGGHAGMIIGTPVFRAAGEQSLGRLLSQPLRG